MFSIQGKQAEGGTTTRETGWQCMYLAKHKGIENDREVLVAAAVNLKQVMSLEQKKQQHRHLKNHLRPYVSAQTS
jgi:hypothetical protein